MDRLWVAESERYWRGRPGACLPVLAVLQGAVAVVVRMGGAAEGQSTGKYLTWLGTYFEHAGAGRRVFYGVCRRKRSRKLRGFAVAVDGAGLRRSDSAGSSMRRAVRMSSTWVRRSALAWVSDLVLSRS